MVYTNAKNFCLKMKALMKKKEPEGLTGALTETVDIQIEDFSRIY